MMTDFSVLSAILTPIRIKSFSATATILSNT